MLRAVRVLGATGGVLLVFYLAYVELFRVDAVCLWCTAVQVLTLVLFGAVLWRRHYRLGGMRRRLLGAAVTAALAAILSVAAPGRRPRLGHSWASASTRRCRRR